MPDQRPNPEQLLKLVQEEESQERRGKLKIYLGFAPGVGKTYTMLQDMIAKRALGLDVVVGIVESHGRKDIEELVKQLEVLPRQEIEYRGKKLLEFDIDLALKRSPAIILIDEMAHSNAPGMRHKKRWQDIKEMLDRGIDVSTTMNVQHVESLNDIVAKILHFQVHETVPDSMLEMADSIELVDLPPDDLLKRLEQGKVYFPAQAEIAAERFFRKGNLIGLRELALRVTAEHVGEQVFLYGQEEGFEHISTTKEKILVCIGPGEESVKLIRVARRMATTLQAHWIAVHIDAVRLQLSEEERNRAIEHLRLAEQLGADTRILTGYDVVKEIINFAHDENITQIVIWKRIRPRWRELLFGSLADEVLRYSGDIDVYVMTGDLDKTEAHHKKTTPPKTPWKVYLIALALIAFATLLNFILFPYLSASNLIMMYLVAVTIVALYGKLGPSILASFLSVICYDFFFIPPFYSLYVAHVQYSFTLLVMLLVSQVISNLTIFNRHQAEIARLAEYHTAALYTLSRQLAHTRGVDKLLDIAVNYLGEVFQSDVQALLPEKGSLVVMASFGQKHEISAKEEGVVQWVYELGQMAGLGTDTLPVADAIYVPMRATEGSIGVFRLHPLQPERLFTPDQMRLLDACSNQIALALEVDRLQEYSKVDTHKEKLANEK
jgi:two-component system sensor histidine kinase KdpD